MAAVGAQIEALAPAGSFFQSWSWTGCLAAERFADPVLLSVRDDGRVVALGLFNRGRSRLAPETLWLGESGVAALDSVYIEHNGLLGSAGFAEAALRALLAGGWRRRVVLSGVDDAHLAAARRSGGVVRVLASRPAPFIDLAALGPGGYLAGLGAGTRYQLRRSARVYAQRGPLSVWRAGTVDEALGVLDELAGLHQASWAARGRPGAFANPAFRRFHAALIGRALPRGEVALLRVTAGEALIGCLYNFVYRGEMLAYQSGFAYGDARPHEKPGLTCHHLAIEQAAAEGLARYDFLAGEDRYKANLAGGRVMLHWLDVVPRWSPRGVVGRVRGL